MQATYAMGLVLGLREDALPPSARMKTTTGVIHAALSNPPRMGAARTVGPYFATNQLKTLVSLPPVATCARSSLIIRSLSGQPTWLHSSRICPQPQTHIILWPMEENFSSVLPAPMVASAMVKTNT